MKKHGQNKAYHPSGAYSVIENHFASFPEYVDHCKKIVESARLDLDTPKRERIIKTNCPFEMNCDSDSRKGVLLLHGLYDSPSIMQSVASHFAQKNFKVRTLLLPGHGTVPGDLLDIKFQDWLACAEFAKNTLKNEVDELYLAGFSTGGLIATYLSLTQPEKIRGLFLWAPAFMLSHALSYMAQYHKNLSWLLPHPQWLCMMEELDYAKYRSFSVNSLCQVYDLAKEVKVLLQKQTLNVPSFWVLTRHDEVLNSNALVKIFMQQTTADSEMIYYAPNETAFVDKRIEWRTSRRPERNIIDISHVALPVAPSHFHYGAEGDFQKILIDELAKTNKKPLVYGSLKNLKLASRSSLVRLTYNPDFDYMMKKVDQFLQKIE